MDGGPERHCLTGGMPPCQEHPGSPYRDWAWPAALNLRQNREGSPQGPQGGAKPGDGTLEADRGSGPTICCRFCLQVITFPGERHAQSGAHTHTFANPHGFVYEIGCFREAPGCRTEGPLLTEFSWFAGYAWRIAVCRRCMNHLGWRFQNGPTPFYGLILKHLVEIDPDIDSPGNS